MSEIQELKERIDKAGSNGVKTAQVRDDYEPIGQMMIRDLCETGEYMQRRLPEGSQESEWHILKADAPSLTNRKRPPNRRLK